jgi:hypothetical protein
MACLAQRDPVAALARGHDAYIDRQRYSSHRPTSGEVSAVLDACLGELLGPTGPDEILANGAVRLHVITAEARGPAASSRRGVLTVALALAAAGNLVGRRTLALQLTRCIFHSAGVATPFAHLRDLPTVHRPLTSGNLRAALRASGSIPLLMDGVRVPGAPGVHWDGGVLDYHLDLDFVGGAAPAPTSAGDALDAALDASDDRAADDGGLVLYPHFYAHLVPGWFDKGLRWRRRAGRSTRRVSGGPCSSRRPTHSSPRCRGGRSPTGRTSTRSPTTRAAGAGGRWSTPARGSATSSPSCSPPAASPTRCDPGTPEDRPSRGGERPSGPPRGRVARGCARPPRPPT